MKSVIPSRYCRTARSSDLWAAAVLSARLLGPLLGLQEGDQGVLHLLLGLEHRVLIGDEQFLEAGVLEPHLVGDLAVIKEIPLEGRPDGAGAAPPVEHIAQDKGRATSLAWSPKVPLKEKAG